MFDILFRINGVVILEIYSTFYHNNSGNYNLITNIQCDRYIFYVNESIQFCFISGETLPVKADFNHAWKFFFKFFKKKNKNFKKKKKKKKKHLQEITERTKNMGNFYKFYQEFCYKQVVVKITRITILPHIVNPFFSSFSLPNRACLWKNP